MSLYESTTINLTITVLDTATIFEGPESIYRYDLPGTAIVEGWALAGVMEQAQKMLPGQWPDVTVEVVADSSGGAMSHEAVKIIRRQLQVHDVVIAERQPKHALRVELEPVGAGATTQFSHLGHGIAEELDDYAGTNGTKNTYGTEDTDDVIDEDENIRPLDESDPLLSRIVRRKGLIAVIIAVVLFFALVAWFFLRTTQSSDNTAAPTTTSIAAIAPAEASTAPTSAAPTSAAPSAAATASTPAHQSIEAGGLRVMLPAGFTHTVEEGLVTATGQDPNLRVIMAMDPLYSVPANALFAEVRAQIDADETLSQPREANGRLTYLEHPGDESEVTWTTWVEDGQQISLGCHTRQAPSMAQRAACRMAAESIEKVS